MKNIIFKVFIASLLLSSFTSIGQTKDDYINGYKEGFKTGYCLNVVDCSAPIPNTRSIFIGDKPLQYPVGYAQGLKDGKQKRINDENMPIKTQSQNRDDKIKETDNNSSTSDPYTRYFSERERIKNQYRSSTKGNNFTTINRGIGFGIAYDVGISGSMDFFADRWMYGIGYGSRVLEDNSNVYATEEKVFGTIGLKITNTLYIKAGIGSYYDIADDYSYLSYDFSGPDYYEIYNNDGSTYFQIGIQAFIPSGSSAITPEVFYSNVSGTIGFGIGIVF